MLIAAKYLTISGLLYASFVLTALLTPFLMWIEDVVTYDPVPSDLSLQALLQAHWLQALAGVAPFFWTIAYTSLAAVLTRSMLAALTISVVVDGIEGVFGEVAGELSKYAPDLVIALYQGLPGYHFQNLEKWIVEGSALQKKFPNGTIVDFPWLASLSVAAAWITAITGLTFWRFRRQDIN
jgi:hypothetical protein